MNRVICNSLAVALLGSMATVGASAQEKITLKVAHPLPGNHYLWEHGMKKFADAVTAASSGKVNFEVYPAGQLGKNYLAIIKSGLADISMIVTSYAPDKFPLTSVTELPGLYSTSCEATDKFWALAKPGAALDKQEYTPLGIRVLFVNTLPSYRFTTISKPVTTLADASGLKIWANGAAMDKTIRSLGAVPVRLTASELFDSVTRGTVDGAFFPYSSLPQYKLEGKINHSVEGVQLGAGSWILAMSDKSWKALPASVKEIMGKVGPATQAALCDFLDKDQNATRDRLVKDHGLKVTTLPADTAKLWAEKLANVSAEWTAEMDAAGRNGSALLKAMRSAGAKQ